MSSLLAIVFFAVLGSVHPLRLGDAEEGTCNEIYIPPLRNGNFNFVDTFRFITAGSRYNFYRIAEGHPRFHEMEDFEMQYNLCSAHNGTMATGQAAVVGFGGRVLHKYNFQPRRNQLSVLDVTPMVSFPKSDEGLSMTLTLTDYKTFAFMVNCWHDSGQRSFVVFSPTPELSPSVKRKVEQHAVSLGFSRKEIVFLDYNSCGGDIEIEIDSEVQRKAPIPFSVHNTGWSQ